MSVPKAAVIPVNEKVCAMGNPILQYKYVEPVQLVAGILTLYDVPFVVPVLVTP